jgi:hypothetical protein
MIRHISSTNRSHLQAATMWKMCKARYTVGKIQMVQYLYISDIPLIQSIIKMVL